MKPHLSSILCVVLLCLPLSLHAEQEADTLTDYLVNVERNNKTHVVKPGTAGAQKAVLNYRIIGHSNNYFLLEIDLLTGRKHQIRAQLANIGCPIKGDLKYGAPRSNPDGGISLQSHHIHFIHPVSKTEVDVTAPLPHDTLWQALAAQVSENQTSYGQL